MAKKKFLLILKRGQQDWNEWRNRNPKIVPDLRNADLCGANLIGWNLNHTDLSEANLFGAHLSGATLIEAKLIDASLDCADLIHSTLSGADLTRAKLRKSELCEATLKHATLRDAQFEFSKLNHANLTGADLSNASFFKADLGGTRLDTANLSGAGLYGTNLRNASLVGAIMTDANLMSANLCQANLRGALLLNANFSYADLTGADLTGTYLHGASLVKTKLNRAILNDASIFGTSVWGVELHGAQQKNLVITESHEPTITVDNLEVAQFIYLLMNNQNIRKVIDTVSSKAVLILGRFTPERKATLEALRDQLRIRDYLPILFDFDKPDSRDLTETIMTLAHLVRFIIADITDARSIPQELQAIVPHLPSVPVKPIMLASQYEYGMFEHLRRYPWVLEKYLYDTTQELELFIDEVIIAPAEELAAKRRG